MAPFCLDDDDGEEKEREREREGLMGGFEGPFSANLSSMCRCWNDMNKGGVTHLIGV